MNRIKKIFVAVLVILGLFFVMFIQTRNAPPTECKPPPVFSDTR